MYHYVYRIDHIETGQFYIGSRTSKVHPTLDPYLGSMSVWKPDRSKLKKSILKDDFLNRDEAMEYEGIFIGQNIEDPLNENYYIPGKGFHTVGMDRQGEKNSFYNKMHSQESIEQMRKSALVRNIDPEMEKQRREGISKTLKGTKKPKEFSENMSKARQGDDNPYAKYLKENGIIHHSLGKKYERVICPHCGREISTSKSFNHFDNCRYKNK